jgi:thioredoxin 1
MSVFRKFPIAIAAAMIATAPASAAEFQDFSRAAFNAAQAQGRPILLEVAAWWCPVCASQGNTVKNTATAPQYAKLIVFKINYDKQKPEWKSFGVPKQGTLIAFKGTRETGRLNFVTDKAQIATLIATTVQ